MRKIREAVIVESQRTGLGHRGYLGYEIRFGSTARKDLCGPLSRRILLPKIIETFANPDRVTEYQPACIGVVHIGILNGPRE